MSWLGRSLASFGNDIGESRGINLDLRARQQQIASEAARQKIQSLMLPLQLQQLQQQIRQANLPQYEGTVAGPGGSVNALTWNPSTSTVGSQSVVSQQVTSDAVARQILNDAQSLSPEDKQYANSLIGSLRDPGLSADPSKVLQEWQRFFAGTAKAGKQKPPVVDVNKGTVTQYDAFGNGTELPIYDAKGNINPSLPPELQPLVQSQVSAFNVKEQQKQREADEQQQRILDRMNQSENFRQKQTEDAAKRSEASRAVTEAINAFRAYQTVSAGSQKIDIGSHWYFPSTWGQSTVAKERADEAQTDAEGKRQAAVQALKNANMPVPDWLTKPIGGLGQLPPPNVPPPTGFVMDRP